VKRPSQARLRPDEAGDPRPRDGQLRRIVLNGQPVDYRLIRARRRSIGMEVHLEGLTVRAPRWVALRDIDAALIERARWIVRALDEWRARRRDVMPREWKRLRRSGEGSEAIMSVGLSTLARRMPRAMASAICPEPRRPSW